MRTLIPTAVLAVLLASAGTADAQWEGRSFDGQSYSGRSFSGQSYSGRSYGGTSYSSRSYNGLSYGGRSYSGESYSGLSYGGESYSGRSYGGESYSGRSYDGSGSSPYRGYVVPYYPTYVAPMSGSNASPGEPAGTIFGWPSGPEPTGARGSGGGVERPVPARPGRPTLPPGAPPPARP